MTLLSFIWMMSCSENRQRIFNRNFEPLFIEWFFFLHISAVNGWLRGTQESLERLGVRYEVFTIDSIVDHQEGKIRERMRHQRKYSFPA